MWFSVILRTETNVITLKVWPDLGPNCLKGLSADDNVIKRFKGIIQTFFLHMHYYRANSILGNI